jgi:hypothetical protein
VNEDNATRANNFRCFTSRRPELAAREPDTEPKLPKAQRTGFTQICAKETGEATVATVRSLRATGVRNDTYSQN